MPTYHVYRVSRSWVLKSTSGEAVLCADDRATAVELSRALVKEKDSEVIITDGNRVEVITRLDRVEARARVPVER